VIKLGALLHDIDDWKFVDEKEKNVKKVDVYLEGVCELNER
jgi:HD superfamily phosphodiesterase